MKAANHSQSTKITKPTPADRFLERRDRQRPGFKKYAQEGLDDFLIKTLIRGAMENAGLTQQELAEKMRTKQTSISRIINHAHDIRLSTLDRVARACGKRLVIAFVE